MLEAERALAGDRRMLFGKDQLAVEQAVERGAAVLAAEMVKRTAPENAPGERSVLEQTLLRRIEPVDARGDERLHGVGNPLERGLFLGEDAGGLLEEERISLGLLEQERALRGRHLGALEQRVREVRSLLCLERPELDGECARIAAGPRRPVLEQLGPSDRDDQQRPGAELPRDVLEQVEQLLLGPVDVLEHEHERLHLGELLCPPPGRPAQLLAGAVAVGGAADAERDGEQLGDRLALATGAQLLDGVVGRIVVGDSGRHLHHRREREVGDPLAVRQRAPEQNRRTLAALRELAHEAGLADARLAEDSDEVGAPIADGAGVHVLEQLELTPAADEGCRAQPALRLERSQCAPGPDRLWAAPDLDLPRALHFDRARSKTSRGRAEQDLARPCRLLEPSGHVHRLACREGRLRVLDHDLA